MRRQAHRLALAVSVLAATMVMIVPAPGRAGVDTDVRAGVFSRADAVGVGAGLLAPIGDRRDRWYANPNAEIAVGSDNMYSLNGDFHYDVSQQRTTSLWLGAGPAVIIEDHNGNRNTDLGMNLLAGVGKSRGSVRPFGQIKGVVADNSGVALVGGLRF